VDILPAIHKITHDWCHLLVRDVTLFGCGSAKDHHHAKSSIPVITEYQKFRVHLYMSFIWTALSTSHCLSYHWSQ